jgi:hypothetical protein
MPERAYVVDFDDKPFPNRNPLLIAVPSETLAKLKADKIKVGVTIRLVNDQRTTESQGRLLQEGDEFYILHHVGAMKNYEPEPVPPPGGPQNVRQTVA